MPRIVVLGTGTGVGKTYCSVLLTRALAAIAPQMPVVAVKPLETGHPKRQRDGDPSPGSDAALLERASTGAAPRPHPLYALPDPVSVHLAARRARVPVSVKKVRAWCTNIPYNTWHVIETAGGVLSPLSPRATNIDLARALEPAIWILVAPDALGVLHDLRATLLALERVARRPDFIVLSAARAADASTGTNAAELRRVGLPRAAAVLRRDERDATALTPLVRALIRTARR
jgi:dethiobiotin synthetase